MGIQNISVKTPAEKKHMSKTILIADDEPSLRLLVKATLKARKYNIVEAVNGQEAHDFALQCEPDLILLDVMMPFMTGFQVCTLLRKQPQTMNTPIVILTAKGGQDDKATALSAGASHFLSKPFRPPDLLKVVDQIFKPSAV